MGDGNSMNPRLELVIHENLQLQQKTYDLHTHMAKAIERIATGIATTSEQQIACVLEVASP